MHAKLINAAMHKKPLISPAVIAPRCYIFLKHEAVGEGQEGQFLKVPTDELSVDEIQRTIDANMKGIHHTSLLKSVSHGPAEGLDPNARRPPAAYTR